MTQPKVALVTGASSGIGKVVADALARKSFRVFGTSRKAAADGKADANPAMIPLDVRDQQSIASAVQTVLDRAGRIDALVNNAGYALVGAVEEMSMDEARDLFETNFFGALQMSKAVLPILRQQGGGRIVNLGSAVGFIPAPYQALYSASKHAIAGYSESLDHEVRQFGIRVSVVEPGFTRTEISTNLQVVRQQLQPYDADRTAVLNKVQKNVAAGDGPSTVAAVVVEALTSAYPQTIYLAGSSRRASLLRKFAPSGMFDKGLRKQFGLTGA